MNVVMAESRHTCILHLKVDNFKFLPNRNVGEGGTTDVIIIKI